MKAQVRVPAPAASIDAVEVKGLGHAYDNSYALVEVSARFPAGTATALLGPNGAGKSTLIRLLSTLSTPTEGAIFVGDARVRGSSRAIRALIGYVGHETMVYSELTARENLRFFGALYGAPQVAARAEALLERVGLTLDMDRPVSGFSRGMAQRLAIARALLPGPALLLLDEPFTGLDQAGVAMALEVFGELRDAGAVLIVASHDLAAVGRLVDRALILRRGRTIFHGAVEGAELGDLYRARIGGAG